MIRITLLLVLLVCTAIVHAQQDLYTLVGEDNNAVIQVHKGRLRYYNIDIFAPYEFHLDGAEIYIVKDGERYPCWPFIPVERKVEPEDAKSLQSQWRNIQLQLQEQGFSRDEILDEFDEFIRSQNEYYEKVTDQRTGEVSYNVRVGDMNLFIIVRSPAWQEPLPEIVPFSKEVLLEAARTRFKVMRNYLHEVNILVVTSQWMGFLSEDNLQYLLEGGYIERVPTLATKQIRQGG